jgi:hypothetical protein
MMYFIDRLPRELEGEDFRVRIRNGGYRPAVEAIAAGIIDHFDVDVSSNFISMKVRIWPDLRQTYDSPLGDEIIFAECEGRLLDMDMRLTEKHVHIGFLRVELDEDKTGKTVGSLRMTRTKPKGNRPWLRQLAG